MKPWRSRQCCGSVIPPPAHIVELDASADDSTHIFVVIGGAQAQIGTTVGLTVTTGDGPVTGFTALGVDLGNNAVEMVSPGGETINAGDTWTMTNQNFLDMPFSVPEAGTVGGPV
jgi:hypothetical protein